jgi:hypothetical protein
MPHGFVGEPVGFVPGRRGAVQIGLSLAALVLQANPQQVGDQLVVAPPLAFLVQGDQAEGVNLVMSFSRAYVQPG